MRPCFRRPSLTRRSVRWSAGYGESISYDRLVARITGTGIDKGSRYTDWAKRPLSDAQIAYALSDVTCLRDVYMGADRPVAVHRPARMGSPRSWLRSPTRPPTQSGRKNSGAGSSRGTPGRGISRRFASWRPGGNARRSAATGREPGSCATTYCSGSPHGLRRPSTSLQRYGTFPNALPAREPGAKS